MTVSLHFITSIFVFFENYTSVTSFIHRVTSGDIFRGAYFCARRFITAVGWFCSLGKAAGFLREENFLTGDTFN